MESIQVGLIFPSPSPRPAMPSFVPSLCGHSSKAFLSFPPSIRALPGDSAIRDRKGRSVLTVFAGARSSMGSQLETERLGFPMDRMEGLDDPLSVSDQQTSQRASQHDSRKFKWNKEMSKFLLEFFAHQVSGGMKVGKSFKRSALTTAAKAVSQKFKTECTTMNVENRIKTLKTQWSRIKKLKGLTEASWDPITKTITLGEDFYKDYVMAKPRDAWLLNSPIENYNELSIIFGDGIANEELTGDANQHIGPSNNDLEEEDGHEFRGLNNVAMKDVASCDEVRRHSQHKQAVSEPIVTSSSPPSVGSRTASSRVKKHKVADVDIQSLFLMLRELVDAIKKLKARDFSEEVWDAIKACDYNERLSITALEYLLKNEVEGKVFLVRTPEMRKEWLAKFFSSFL